MDELPKLSKKQHAKDSEVFGAIMAGAKSRKKRLMQSLPAMETPQAMCAVGAGLRGRKKTRWSDVVTKAYQKENSTWSDPDGLDASDTKKHQLIPMIRFAMAMDVSEDYVCGVNDGFEDSKGAHHCFFKADMDSLDYLRGWHVGQAILIEMKPKEA